GQDPPDAHRRQPPDDRLRRSGAEREDQGVRQGHHGDERSGARLPDEDRLPVGRHVGAAGGHWRGAAARSAALCRVHRSGPPDRYRRAGRPPDGSGARGRDRVDAGPRACHRAGAGVVADVIPYLDLAAQYRGIKSEIRAAMDRVLDTNAYILGPEVKAFEEAFAAAHDVRHAVAVNSGTSALHLALLALGVGPGDEVITTPFTFIATVAAIGYTGATPVFVDIDPGSFTLDPSKIEAAITPKTKVIMPVHLYGQPADMDPILAVAKRHGLHVVEDAAQAHLAEYKGRKVGSFGAIACFSFYPGKNLGAYGEGGAAVTNDDRYAATMRALRDWGQTERYRHAMKGYNYRMDGLQGAVLGV